MYIETVLQNETFAFGSKGLEPFFAIIDPSIVDGDRCVRTLRAAPDPAERTTEHGERVVMENLDYVIACLSCRVSVPGPHIKTMKITNTTIQIER